MANPCLYSALVLLLAIATFGANHLLPPHRPIIDLNHDTAQSFLASHPFVLLLIFGSHSAPYSHFRLEFASASLLLHQIGSPVQLAQLDGVRNPRSAARYGISEFPRLVFFANSSDEPYTGGYTRSEIFLWVRKRTNTPVTTISSLIDAEQAIKRNKRLVVGFFGNFTGTDYEEFIAAARVEAETEFVQVAQQEVADVLNVGLHKSPPFISIVIREPESVVAYENIFEREKIMRFVEVNKHSDLTKFNLQDDVEGFSNRIKLQVHLQRASNRGFVMSTCTDNPSSLLYSFTSSASEIAESISNEETIQKFGTEPLLSHKLPHDAVLQFNLEDPKWMKCTSSAVSEVSGHEKLEVLGLERNLIGNGAHRELSTSLAIRSGEISTCHVVTVDKLQSGVFADKFELDGLVARQVYTDAQVYGDHNLERPSLHSSQSIVVLHAIFSTGNTKSEGLGLVTQVKVSLPLHARYPPLSMESHVQVNFTLPYVLFHCSSDNTEIDDTKMDGKKAAWTVLSWSKKISLESRVLHWAVPAGNPVHTQFIAVMTAFTALIGVVMLLVVSSYSFGTLK